MSFCYCCRSSILEIVFSQRSKTTREEEAKGATIEREEEETNFEGKVHKKKKNL